MANYNPKMLSMFGQSASIFGVALPEIAKRNDKVVVLSADMSTPAGLDKFKSKFPDRFYNLGIAEQNMIGTAAGLSSEGYIPVCVAQACFLSMRDYEQIRQFCGYMGKKAILIGLSSGFSLSYFGQTHYAIEDIALMRTIPDMTIMAPSDALEAVKDFEEALDLNGPVYIRLFGSTGIPTIYDSKSEFKPGKGNILRQGSDLQIIATGSMVKTALDIADALEDRGISTSIVDMNTIKPLDEGIINQNAKLIVSLEEHLSSCGLGAVIANFLSSQQGSPRLLKIGVDNYSSVIGDYNFMLRNSGLSKEQIVEKILDTSINSEP